MKKMNSGRLRIAMLGQKHSFSREGGIEVAVGELAGRMARLGHKVTLLDRSPRPSRSMVPRTEDLEIRCVPTLGRGGLAALTSSFFGAVKAAFGKYDVVHFHAEGPAAMCLIPRLLGKRVVCTVHGLDWQREKWGRLARAYIKLGEKTAVMYAHEMIVLNNDTRDYFLKAYRRGTRVIPNGASPAPNAPVRLIRQAWGLEKDGYVLFVGRLVPEKGLRLLLKAWKKLKTDTTLVIAGGGASESFMGELASLAGENVLFTGFVEGQALSELYCNCRLFVLPSDLEGMPLALLEALSSGCCCLASDIPACRETARDKAVYFERGSESSLIAALQTLLDSPGNVSRYREGAKEFVLSNYDWDEITLKTLAAYRGTETDA
ncbi:MAG: glycosyltransferase family 4 protein [Clostridia bacterium]|nr:glycosyltransferase family 4 protein [Clostridia bacterium]